MDEYPYIAQGGTPGNCSFNDSGIVASISSMLKGDKERRRERERGDKSGG